MKTKIESTSKDASCRRLGVYHRHHMEWQVVHILTSYAALFAAICHITETTGPVLCLGHSLDLFASDYTF